MLTVLPGGALDCLAAEDALLFATTSKFPVGSMIAFITVERGKERERLATFKNVFK